MYSSYYLMDFYLSSDTQKDGRFTFGTDVISKVSNGDKSPPEWWINVARMPRKDNLEYEDFIYII